MSERRSETLMLLTGLLGGLIAGASLAVSLLSIARAPCTASTSIYDRLSPHQQHHVLAVGESFRRRAEESTAP